MKIQTSLLVTRAKHRLEAVNKEMATRRLEHDSLEKKFLSAKAAAKAAEMHFLRQLSKHPGNAVTRVDTASYAPNITFSIEGLLVMPSRAFDDLRRAKQALGDVSKKLAEAKKGTTPQVVGHGRSAWPNEAMVLARQAQNLTELIETLKSTKADGEITLPAKSLANLFPEFA